MTTHAELRQRADAQAREDVVPLPGDLATRSPADIRHTLHELRVHQIELEMQNEELRQAQVDLEAARALYFDLYDLAPVGYITVSEPGLIQQANLTAAALLGVVRSVLVGKPFSQFICREDQDLYYHHRQQLFATRQPQAYELRLLKPDDTIVWTHLATTAAPNSDSGKACHIVLVDISARKQAEAEIAQQLDELKRWQNVTIGREGRVMELKREVNALATRLGEAPRYASVLTP